MTIFPPVATIIPGGVDFDSEDPNTGQKLDLLDRKDVGQRLPDLLERVSQPMVVALDGGWGSGKSHFLKLWTGAHTRTNKGTARVIYFDAFEHDYLDDPLISLVGAIIAETPKEPRARAALTKVKKAAWKLARPAVRVGLALATAGGTEVAGAILDKGIKAAGKSASESFDNFWKKEAGRTAAMKEFRAALEDMTKPAEQDGNPRKLIFIIDELDRCRPDYALTLLEIIKHFFAVPNVHFVLGTNLTALENSVKARYGEGIDATQYLQKFVHFRLSLPQASSDPQTTIAWEVYFDAQCKQKGVHITIAAEFRRSLTLISQKQPPSLRDIERVLMRMLILPQSFDSLAW